MKSRMLLGLAAGAAALFAAAPATADPTAYYLGQIIVVSGTFCPEGTYEADGSLHPVSDPLFTVIGNTFGGDGTTQYAVPDLRGRVAIGEGNFGGIGGTIFSTGEAGGAQSVGINNQQLAPHDHPGITRAYSGSPTTDMPVDGSLATFQGTQRIYNNNSAPRAPMAAGTVSVSNAGGGQHASIQSPVLAMRYCVSYVGIYPYP